VYISSRTHLASLVLYKHTGFVEVDIDQWLVWTKVIAVYFQVSYYPELDHMKI